MIAAADFDAFATASTTASAAALASPSVAHLHPTFHFPTGCLVGWLVKLVKLT